jgi:hypothetical protein
MYEGGGIIDNLGNKPLTYDRVQHWPTNPAGLVARIASYSDGKTKSYRLQTLVELETEVPAPPGGTRRGL